MSETPATMKTDLIEEIELAWTKLHSYLSGLSEAQLTSIADHEGWTVKDHLTHIAEWEESVVSFFHGRPRSEGLGVDEEIYSRGSIDEVNAAIREQHRSISLEEATTQMRAAHLRLLAVLDQLADEDLVQPLRHFVPTSPEEDDRKAVDLIRDNSSRHYAEHLDWIVAFVGHKDSPQ